MSFRRMCQVFSEVGVLPTLTELSCAKWIANLIYRPLQDKMRSTTVDETSISQALRMATDLREAAQETFGGIELFSELLKVLEATEVLLQAASHKDGPPKHSPSHLRQCQDLLVGEAAKRTPWANALNYGSLAIRMFEAANDVLTMSSADEVGIMRVQKLEACFEEAAKTADDEDFKIRSWLIDLDACWASWTASATEKCATGVENIFACCRGLFDAWRLSSYEDIGAKDFEDAVNEALQTMTAPPTGKDAGNTETADDPFEELASRVPDIFNPSLASLKRLSETFRVAQRVEQRFGEILDKHGLPTRTALLTPLPQDEAEAMVVHAVGVSLGGAPCLRRPDSGYEELLAEWMTKCNDDHETDGVLQMGEVELDGAYLERLARATKAGKVLNDICDEATLASIRRCPQASGPSWASCWRRACTPSCNLVLRV